MPSLFSATKSALHCERVPWRGDFHTSYSNAHRQHPAEAAAWIWAGEHRPSQPRILRFHRKIRVDHPATVHIHVSADQRFQLYIHGALVATGPDRCDVEHWSVASYRLELPAGEHEFVSLVWWLPDGSFQHEGIQGTDQAPMAQMTWRGGFLLAAEGEWHQRLSTGIAPWWVTDLTSAMTYVRPDRLGYHDIGPQFEFAMDRWSAQAESSEAVQVRAPIPLENPYGIRQAGWRFFPTSLPEQRSDIYRGGHIRAAREDHSASPFTDGQGGKWRERFSSLIEGGRPVRIPAACSLDVLWDFQDYICGYPMLETSGGAGATVQFQWAESLYEVPADADGPDYNCPKGHRGQVEGKSFLGFGDSWTLQGKKTTLPTLWWRSGRYARLRIQTTDAPLVLRSMALRATGYPLEITGRFDCDDPGLLKCWPLMLSGMKNCAHETWVDCPYYEQLCYVGDAVTELGVYTVSPDARLTRRCLEFFDWSRSDGGLVAERYPSRSRQDSTTYAMLYPRMLHDYAFWKDDPTFVQARLPGLRALIEQFLAFLTPEGLVGKVPGWPFIDWVAEPWQIGCSPGGRTGDSSLLNLHLYFALRQHAGIERAYGDALLARRADFLAQELGRKTLARYWDDRSHRLADDSSKRHFSEHAQAWAILSGCLRPTEERRCLAAWLATKNELAQASIYFSYYLLEALYKAGAGEEFHRRLAFWKRLPEQGFLTPPEQPEPSRSDCHGWGSHPIYHAFASIAGIRPASVGFARVRIAPLPDTLRRIHLQMPHPKGTIHMDFQRDKCRAKITLPTGIEGEFVWQKLHHELQPGTNSITWQPE